MLRGNTVQIQLLDLNRRPTVLVKQASSISFLSLTFEAQLSLLALVVEMLVHFPFHMCMGVCVSMGVGMHVRVNFGVSLCRPNKARGSHSHKSVGGEVGAATAGDAGILIWPVSLSVGCRARGQGAVT